MKRIIRRVITTVTTETWSVVEDETADEAPGEADTTEQAEGELPVSQNGSLGGAVTGLVASKNETWRQEGGKPRL